MSSRRRLLVLPTTPSKKEEQGTAPDELSLVVDRVYQWTADPDRWKTARQQYDFDRLEFVDRKRGGKRFNGTATATASTIGATAETSNLLSSRDFSYQLDLQPSDRLAQQLLMRDGSSTKGLRNSGRSLPVGLRALDKLLPAQDLTLVGRDAQVEMLQTFLQNAIRSSSKDRSRMKMSVVVGPSGCGKSVLALEVLKNTAAQRRQTSKCIWCTGKFDQQNQSDPYEAIAQAISSLIATAVQDEDLLKDWRQAIAATLGEEIKILMELVSEVAILMPSPEDNTTTSPIEELANPPQVEPNNTCVALSRDRSITEKATRIQNVLVELLRLVATKEHPITLLLDDIQWASSSALALMDALMADQTLQHFCVLATCRQEYLQDDEDDTDRATTRTPLQQLLERRSCQIHQLVIDGLDVAGVHQLINSLLRMDDAHEPRTHALAEIVHHKCNGNPFFVVQFMNLLVDQQLLTYDWGKGSWNWLEGDIQSQNVASNVADAVQRRLQPLSPQTQFILQVASCIGTTFERQMLQFVVTGLSSCNDQIDNSPDLGKTLEDLHDLGILEKQFIYGRYNFSHDQVQAAAFGLIPESKRTVMQTAIGRVLITGLDEKHRDQYLFTAIQLWGKGVSAMAQVEKKHYTFWAFLAGDAALKQGAFDSALSFLNTSIECLGDNPFQEDPELALPLFSGAAEACYCLNDRRVLEYVKAVQQQSTIAKSDMIRVAIIELKVLSNNRDFTGCVNSFRRICRELGAARFSKKPGIPSLLYHIVKTNLLLKKYDREMFLQLPVCKNPNIAGALQAENVCFAQLYMSNPNLCVIATCQAVQWSIRHGHSKATAPALVSMAMMLIGISANYDLAYEVGEIALELCNLHGYKESLPSTIGLVFGYVRHWVKPMHDFVAPMRYAMDLGMRIGNMDDCGMLFSTFGMLLFLCQIDTLTSAIQEVEGYRHIMMQHNIKDHLVFTECNLQFAYKMAVDHEDSWSLSGDIMKEEDMFALAAKNKDLILAAFIHYQKMMLNVYFGRPLDAATFAAKNADVGFTICQGCHFVPRNTFFVGLSMVLAYRVDGKARRLKSAKLMEKRLKEWLKSGNPNVLHFLHLLQAELKYSRQKYAEAQDAYIQATKVSMRTGFKLDFALSNELLSIFYSDAANPFQDRKRSQHHFQVAIDSYGAYGAANKARHMRLKRSAILEQQY